MGITRQDKTIRAPVTKPWERLQGILGSSLDVIKLVYFCRCWHVPVTLTPCLNVEWTLGWGDSKNYAAEEWKGGSGWRRGICLEITISLAAMSFFPATPQGCPSQSALWASHPQLQASAFSTSTFGPSPWTSASFFCFFGSTQFTRGSQSKERFLIYFPELQTWDLRILRMESPNSLHAITTTQRHQRQFVFQK